MNEAHVNTNPLEADTSHVQNVLNQHAAGRLIVVLTCKEEFDGATWTALVRNANDNLQHVEVNSEPGYNEVNTLAELS